jgi:hypothetical protein
LKTWIPPNFERGRSYQREVGKQKSREAEQARVKIDTEKLIKEQVAEATKQAVAEQVNATTPNRQAGAATPSPLSA